MVLSRNWLRLENNWIKNEKVSEEFAFYFELGQGRDEKTLMDVFNMTGPG